MKPDALIMADPGLIMMVRETYPDMPIHLSVQANTVNYATVNFWKSMGVERVILSRELSLDEIAEIRQRCPDTELEVLCMVRYVSLIQVVVYYRVILITAILIKALVPILAVGNTTPFPHRKMRRRLCVSQ